VKGSVMEEFSNKKKKALGFLVGASVGGATGAAIGVGWSAATTLLHPFYMPPLCAFIGGCQEGAKGVVGGAAIGVASNVLIPFNIVGQMATWTALGLSLGAVTGELAVAAAVGDDDAVEAMASTAKKHVAKGMSHMDDFLDNVVKNMFVAE
jgi:hypothetical protein